MTSRRAGFAEIMRRSALAHGFEQADAGGEAIQAAALQLGLDWEQRILDSYLMLFDMLKARLGLTFNDLSFENFQGLTIPPAALGAKPADGEKL